VTVLLLALLMPPLSETDAVMVCVPADSGREKLPPLPIAPSMFDVHVNREVRFPSCVSDAEPEKVIEVPCAKLALLPGEEIDTLGAVFVGADGGAGDEAEDLPYND
jgi:hypothetical protein